MGKLLTCFSFILLLASCTTVRTAPISAHHKVSVGDEITLVMDASYLYGPPQKKDAAGTIRPTKNFKDPDKVPDFRIGEKFIIVDIESEANYAVYAENYLLKSSKNGKYALVNDIEYGWLFR
jgi:hypothetical protein